VTRLRRETTELITKEVWRWQPFGMFRYRRLVS
jgi:hypothetical protein